MRGEQWRDEWWREFLCGPCQQGRHGDCDPLAYWCECAVEAWLTDYERDDDA